MGHARHGARCLRVTLAGDRRETGRVPDDGVNHDHYDCSSSRRSGRIRGECVRYGGRRHLPRRRLCDFPRSLRLSRRGGVRGSARCLDSAWPRDYGSSWRRPHSMEHDRIARRALHVASDGARSNWESHTGHRTPHTPKERRVTPAPDSESESELRARAELLRVTLDSIGDAVITTNNQGDVTSLNATAQTLTGWSTDQAVGQPLDSVFTIVNEETREVVESPAARALHEGVAVNLADHTVLIAKDGTERTIDDSAAPVQNEAGEVSGVVLIFRDVSERREQERGLRDALEYAESILATVREPLLVLDRNLRVITANRSFYEVFRATPAETVGRSIYELGDGQWDIPQLRRHFEDVSTEMDSAEIEVVHDFPSIGRRAMRLNVRRLVDDRNEARRTLVAIEDVTERKEVAEAISRSELKYRRLFEAALDGILILDSMSGRIIDANPFVQRILGRSLDDLRGLRLWEIGSLANVAENEARFEELRSRGHVRYDHLPLETEAGVQTEVEFVSNVYEVDGHEVIQCNIRDITDRRRLERETERQAAELADLDRRKDEFLAMLSHELRNPLAPITSAVRILGRQPIENTAQREAREVIERQSAQLTHIVDDLLEVSRITTGRIRLRIDRIDLRVIIDRSLEATRHEVERRHHILHTSVPATPLWVDGDPVRLEEVIVNIITNAVKYTDDGGHIELTAGQDAGVVTVRTLDDGIGVSAELRPHIFELFTQGERSLARSEGGLGIGLALVKQLTEMHGGSVTLSESSGLGSEFVVTLPVATGAVPAIPSTHALEAVAPAGALRVLLVDDNVDMVRVFQLLVEEDGHEVEVAYEGQSALAAALRFRPDVALLDIGLPGWDGYEVARRIRAEPTLSRTALVAITGYGR
ncbi:MAG: PAS domain S-box protein, partial [Dehalococcoidia bacterium]